MEKILSILPADLILNDIMSTKLFLHQEMAKTVTKQIPRSSLTDLPIREKILIRFATKLT